MEVNRIFDNGLSLLTDTKTKLKEAIRAKGGTITDQDTFRVYPDKIKEIPSSTLTVVPDIFNHGDVELLNPYFKDCDLNWKSTTNTDYGFYTKKEHSFNVGAVDSSNKRIYISGSNITVAFPKPFSTRGYKYLYLDLETRWTGYSYSTLVIEYWDTLNQVGRCGIYEVVGVVLAQPIWYVKGNHSSTVKRSFSRNIIQLDASKIDGKILGFQQCDQYTYIYSIWLSNEEEPHYDFSQDYES